MNTNSSSPAVAALHREQTRLRIWLAAILLSTVSVFALVVSSVGRTDPLQPLLMVKLSLLLLLSVYAVGVGVAWIYARWIRLRREPAARSFTNGSGK